MTSLVSANGPSLTSISPSLTATVLASRGGLSRSPSSRMPRAITSSSHGKLSSSSAASASCASASASSGPSSTQTSIKNFTSSPILVAARAAGVYTITTNGNPAKDSRARARDPRAGGGSRAFALESAIVRSALLREVRLGLVCYGGVSLAIYMHGVTKELYKLVRAARAFENAYDRLGGQVPADEDPGRWLAGPGLDTERAYFAALAALSARGTPLTVTLDLIAGTSAGGINGVCLARGLAEGRSLDGFRNLWLDDADMEELLAGHALLPWGQAKLLTKLAESAARLLWHREAGLLDGDLMSRLLYQALDGMQALDGAT